MKKYQNFFSSSSLDTLLISWHQNNALQFSFNMSYCKIHCILCWQLLIFLDTGKLPTATDGKSNMCENIHNIKFTHQINGNNRRLETPVFILLNVYSSTVPSTSLMAGILPAIRAVQGTVRGLNKMVEISTMHCSLFRIHCNCCRQYIFKVDNPSRKHWDKVIEHHVSYPTDSPIFKYAINLSKPGNAIISQ